MVQVLFTGFNEANTVSYCPSDDLIELLIMCQFAENLVIHLFWVKLVFPEVESLMVKDQFRRVICLSHIVLILCLLGQIVPIIMPVITAT